MDEGRVRALITVVFVIFAPASAAFAQTVMTVSDVAAYALKHSREITAAEKAVRHAEDTMAQVFNLDKSSLTLSGDYTYTQPAASQTAVSPAARETNPIKEHTVDVQGSISVPIIPELSVSASLSNPIDELKWDPTASVRVSFNPFSDTQTGWKEWETLRKAEIQLDNLRNSIPMSAEAAALNLIKGQLDLESAGRAMKHAEKEYETAKKRFELEDMTYSELEGVRTAAGASRQKYYNSQKTLLTLKKNLYQIIGPDLGDIKMSELTFDDVQLLLETRGKELEAARTGEAATVGLLSLAVELEALKRQLKATLVFQPNISVSGNVNPFGSLRAGASVSVTFSPDQIQVEERDDIKTAIADKEFDLALEQANLNLEVRMLEESVAVAREAVTISKSDYESSFIQFKEAELLFQRGERTELELETSELSLFSSSIGLFAAAVDLYRNMGDLLRLYRLD